MRQYRLFFSKFSTTNAVQNSAEPELPDQTQMLPAAAELSIKAEKYIASAKMTIEPLLKDPAVTIGVTEDLKKALSDLKEAAEIYEKINSWNDAIFAWSMIQAVPVAPEFQWNASEKIQQCQRHIQPQLIPHPPARPPYRSV